MVRLIVGSVMVITGVILHITLVALSSSTGGGFADYLSSWNSWDRFFMLWNFSPVLFILMAAITFCGVLVVASGFNQRDDERYAALAAERASKRKTTI